MPLVIVHTSAPAAARERSQALVRALSARAAATLGKPEKYMMVHLATDAAMIFGGSEEPSAYVEVRSIGALTRESAARLTESVSAILEESLGLPKGRVYVVCDDVPGHLWGYDGRTFA